MKTSTVIIAIAGLALVGGGIYFMTRPKTVASALSTPAPYPATTTTQATSVDHTAQDIATAMQISTAALGAASNIFNTISSAF